MRNWKTTYTEILFRLRFLAIAGNLLVVFIASREIWWMVHSMWGFGPVPGDMLPYIVWDSFAALLVTLLCFFRILTYCGLVRNGFVGMILSGGFLSSLLLVYWANSISLWTCYIYNPSALECTIFDIGRADVLAGIAPIYVGIAFLRNAVVLVLSNYIDGNETDPNS